MICAEVFGKTLNHPGDSAPIQPGSGTLRHLAFPKIEITFEREEIWTLGEDGGEIGGSGVHFPSTPVKYLVDLRSRANSQRYSSIYEYQRPKIEAIEKSDCKKSA